MKTASSEVCQDVWLMTSVDTLYELVNALLEASVLHQARSKNNGKYTVYYGYKPPVRTGSQLEDIHK